MDIKSVVGGKFAPQIPPIKIKLLVHNYCVYLPLEREKRETERDIKCAMTCMRACMCVCVYTSVTHGS